MLPVLRADDVNLDVEGFLKVVSTNKAVQILDPEEFGVFYRQNKVDIWSAKKEREFWKEFTPLVISYDDKELVKLILLDKTMADYERGVMFGWTPMVWAPLKSKLPYVLQLVYFSDGVTGIEKFTNDLKKEITSRDSIEFETKNRQHPLAKYEMMNGVFCSLPKVTGQKDKLKLATITIEYFDELHELFLKTADPETNDALIKGLRDGLFNYYFYSEDEKNPPSRENTIYWPSKEECFDIRSYYTDLITRADALSVEEDEFVNKFKGMQEILGQ